MEESGPVGDIITALTRPKPVPTVVPNGGGATYESSTAANKQRNRERTTQTRMNLATANEQRNRERRMQPWSVVRGCVGSFAVALFAIALFG